MAEPALSGGGRRSLRLVVRIGVATCLAVLAAAGVGIWLIPRLVQSEALKPRILAEISRRAGTPVEAGAIDVDLWPIPRFHLQSLRFRFQFGDVTAASTDVTLSLPLLLRGGVRVTSVRVDGFHASLRIPEVPFSEEPHPTLNGLEEKVARGLAALYRVAPGLAISLRGGRVDLSDGKANQFRLDGVEARFATDPRRFSFSSSFSTPLSERISLEGALDPEAWRGSGRLSVTHLRSGRILRYLLPQSPGAAVDADATGTVTLATAGRGSLTATVEGETPLAVLPLAREGLSLRGAKVKATVAVSESGGKATVESLVLEAPRLGLAGLVAWDTKAGVAKADFRGREADVGALIQAASRLAPAVEELRVARDVVRGGTVRDLTIRAQARSPRALLSVDAMELRGEARDVSLHIPGAEIEVTGGAGNVVFSRGVLQGTKLSGKTDGGVARDGSLFLALVEPNPRFHLVLDLSAELPQVAALVRRLVPPGDFARELALVRGVAGTATGRLTLGERLKNIKVQVDASAVDATGTYARFPFPLALRATRFVLRGNELLMEGVSGTAGRSRLQGVSGSVTWSREATLRIAAAAGRLELSEFFPWLLTFQAARTMFRDVGPPVGTVAVEALSLSGPFFRPPDWRFRLGGGLEGFAVRSVLFPDVLRIAKARLEATERDLTLSDAAATLMDAVVRADVRVERYRDERPPLDVSLSGRLGRRATDWISARIDLPNGLRILRPLEVLRGHLTRSGSGDIAYSGDHLAEDGPEVSLSVHQSGAQWGVDRLFLRDGASNATLTLRPLPNGYQVGLQGKLRSATIDALVGRNPFLRGAVEGDFRAELDTRKPIRSSFVGWVRASDLQLLRMKGLPLLIEAASVRGSGKTAQIESSVFTFGSQRFRLKGRVEAGADALNTDLVLSGDEVDGTVLVQEMDAALERLPPASGGGDPLQAFWKIPARGTVKTELARLRVGGTTIAPFAVVVTLAPGRLTADASRLGVCGISFPSRLEATPERANLRVVAKAKGADLGKTLTCLGHEGVMMGAFDFKTELSGTGVLGKPRDLLKALQGDLSFKAKDGRIFRLGILAKIFAVLNVTEILRGRLPDLFGEGFGYRTMRSDSSLADGKLVFKEGVIDGSSMTLLWDGTVDLSTRDTDLTVVVAPLKTLDAIVSRIPVINYLLDRTLLSIPVRVTGDLADPTIVALSPTALGRRILGLLERTLRLPYKLIQPLLPKQDEKKAP